MERFNNLSEVWQTAIFGAVVLIGLTAVGGLIKLIKWLFCKKKDPDLALKIVDDTLKDNKQLRQTVKQLEEQLAKPSLETNIASNQSTPVPPAEAKELANLISEDDGPYAQALKAIAQGDNEKADSFLDDIQKLLDTVQQKKDEAQAKIYIARMQNASYAGKAQDALEYCDKLTTLAGDDPQVINNIAVVYYENAKYDKAEPLMRRVVKILENPGGEPFPNYAGALNNLAELLRATNRLGEAEPLYRRALAIDEASFGPNHPDVARDLNNLAKLLRDTNRLDEGEPLMRRALAIFEKSLGAEHPSTVTVRRNLERFRDKDN